MGGFFLRLTKRNPNICNSLRILACSWLNSQVQNLKQNSYLLFPLINGAVLVVSLGTGQRRPLWVGGACQYFGKNFTKSCSLGCWCYWRGINCPRRKRTHENQGKRVSKTDDQSAVDDRSPTAKALSKVAQITTISLMMIIPAIIGYFVDQYFGTVILFTALGLVFGIGSAVYQLVQFVSAQNSKSASTTKQAGD